MAKLLVTNAILLIITFQTLSGQAKSSCDCESKINSGPFLSGELFIPAVPLDVKTYFNRDWLLSDVYIANGEIVRNKYIKYNRLLDELFWLEPSSNKIIKLDKEGILKFHILNVQGDTSVYFRKLKVKRDIFTDSSEIYGQEIYHGKLSLFILHTFYIEEREIISMNKGIFQKDIYAEAPIYFLKLMNIKAVGFKNLNRKNMYAFVPDKKEQIKRFFKQIKQSKIETYPDIILLMKFLNSIVEK